MSKLGGQHVTALCLLWALACSEAWQPSDGGVVPSERRLDRPDHDVHPVQPHEPVEPVHVLMVSEGLGLGWVHGCGAGFTREAASVDPIGAVTERSPFHCTGGEDGFDCECNGERKTSRAYSCVAALFQACGAVAEAIDGSGVVAPAPERCTSFGPETGDCSRLDDGYECRCVRSQSPWPMRTFVPMPAAGPSPASCDQAVFSVCAQSCADDFGICEPSPGGTIGAYACTCRTNDLARVIAANGCEEALSHCDPLKTTESQCSGFGGFCEATDGRVHCGCIDGSQHEIPLKADTSVRCQELLESTCGLGAPTESELCVKEANGYRARCTRSPSVLGGLRCECHRQDASPGEGRVFDALETACNEATLVQLCAEVAPVDDEATAQACQHYIDCEAVPGLTPARCTEDIGDSCVACTLAELLRVLPGPMSCPSSPVNCAESCGSALFLAVPD